MTLEDLALHLAKIGYELTVEVLFQIKGLMNPKVESKYVIRIKHITDGQWRPAASALFFGFESNGRPTFTIAPLPTSEGHTVQRAISSWQGT